MTVHTASEADQVAAALAGAAGRHFAGPATIERLKRASGGGDRQTWSVGVLVDGKRHGLVLRRDPPTTGPVGGKTGAGSSTALDRAREVLGLGGRRQRGGGAHARRV